MEKLINRVGEILWENDFSDARGEIANEIQSIAIAFTEWTAYNKLSNRFNDSGSQTFKKNLFSDFINNYYNK